MVETPRCSSIIQRRSASTCADQGAPLFTASRPLGSYVKNVVEGSSRMLSELSRSRCGVKTVGIRGRLPDTDRPRHSRSPSRVARLPPRHVCIVLATPSHIMADWARHRRFIKLKQAPVQCPCNSHIG
jgi:hypothetical protein